MTWELTNVNEYGITHLKQICRVSKIDKLDKQTVNISISDEDDDKLVDFCEGTDIQIRLL